LATATSIGPRFADRLGVTRPALYHHYRSKEDILTAIHAELTDAVDAIIDWARAQPRGRGTRHETVRRLAALLRGPWGSFTRFAQASQAAMRDLSAAEEYTRRMAEISDLLAPSGTPAGRLRGRLALTALFMAVTGDDGVGDTAGERADAALEVAFSLTR
jgi:AcrR family transcriptional regulator